MRFDRTDNASIHRCSTFGVARCVAIALAVSFAFASFPPPWLHARSPADEQPPAAAAQSPQLTTDELQRRLNALRREMDEERTALANAQRRFDDEAAELAQRREQLADRLLGLEIERERGEAKLRPLRTASADAAATAKNLAQRATSLAAAVRDAAEQLRLHLSEVPGNDDAVDRLRKLTARIVWPSDADESKAAQSLDEFVAICDAAHAQAIRVGVVETEVFTATGNRERIQLLAVGHVRFAYVTVDGGRVGIALSSADEASGYRWTEDIDSQTRQLVRDAVERIASAESDADGGVGGSADTGIVAVPLDPTGRLAVEAAAIGESSIYEWFAAGGLVMIPLVCVAAAALALIVERTIFFFVRNRSAEKLAADVLVACRADRYDEAELDCARRRGVVPRVLAACLSRRPLGQRAMEDSIQEQLLHELPRLQRYMGALATLAGVAPLLGLLGTVTGIIQTFSVIRSFGNTNPSLMAGGISEALVTTALGLLIAVPVVIVHSLLRSRSDRIVADAERHSATLLTSLVHRRPTEPPIVASSEPPPRQRTAPRVAKAARQPTAAAPRQPAKELTVDP